MAERISEIINRKGDVSTYSLEITPGIKEYELESSNLEPKFISITWHAHVHGCKDLEIEPIKLAKYLRSKGHNVMLHISCNYMRADYLGDLMKLLKDIGICNLFIILGEKFNAQNSDFERTQDMISHIRQCTGNYFCIGVAGYPDREENILQLKQKVNCGADFILTQAIFDCNAFKKFIINCKEVGINVPVIPGIFPFETVNELKGFVKLCKVHVSENIITMNKPGIEIVTEIIKELTQQLQIKHLHFFTLNKLARSTNFIRYVN